MTTQTNHGIPTEYRGYQFRSRAEARWAAFFDQLGWAWEYEPIDLDGYIPDFVLEDSLLVEVKGGALTCNDLKQYSEGMHPRVELLLPARPVFCSDADLGGDFLVKLGSARCTSHRAGANESGWTYGILAHCLKCSELRPWATELTMNGNTCLSCGDGSLPRIVAGKKYRNMWAKACNLTQWRGRQAA